jgi:hypothetical protein
MAAVIIVASLLPIVVVEVDFIPLRSRTNSIGSCGAASQLSATRSDTSNEGIIEKLMSGVVGVRSHQMEYCSFPSYAEKTSQKGMLFAGPRKKDEAAELGSHSKSMF